MRIMLQPEQALIPRDLGYLIPPKNKPGSRVLFYPNPCCVLSAKGEECTQHSGYFRGDKGFCFPALQEDYVILTEIPGNRG